MANTTLQVEFTKAVAQDTSSIMRTHVGHFACKGERRSRRRRDGCELSVTIHLGSQHLPDCQLAIRPNMLVNSQHAKIRHPPPTRQFPLGADEKWMAEPEEVNILLTLVESLLTSR
jgi:hypothetical protein